MNYEPGNGSILLRVDESTNYFLSLICDRMLQGSSDPPFGERWGVMGACSSSPSLQALVASLRDCDISPLTGLSNSKLSLHLPILILLPISQETEARGASGGCNAGERQNQSRTSKLFKSQFLPVSFISLTPLSDVTPSPKTLHGYFAGVTLAEQSLPKPFLQAAASASEQPIPITLSKL